LDDETQVRPEPADHLDPEGLPKDRPRGVLRRIIGGALSYGVIIIIFGSMARKLQDESGSGQTFAPVTVAEVAVITLFGLINLFTNLPPITITLRGLRLREAAVTNTASAALSNTVPEGGAVATGLNFAMLRSWGFGLDPITSSYLTTGIWTNICRYSLFALGLVALTVVEPTDGPLLAIAAIVTALIIAAVIVLLLVLRSDGFAAGLGRLGGRIINPVLRRIHRSTVDDLPEKMIELRRQLTGLVRDRWRSLTATMYLSQIATILTLGAAVRMMGLDSSLESWPRIVVAYGATALASLIVPTPGGLGVAEACLLAILGANLPEQYLPQLTSAVLLYRYATWLLPIPLGAGSYLYWRKSTAWRMSDAERDARIAGGPVAATLADA
jgi:uncharacterized membrane protein YbhN (UPF0104 family)